MIGRTNLVERLVSSTHCDTLQVALDLTHGLRRWMWQTKAGDNGSGWPRLNKNGAVIQGVTNGWQTGCCSGRFAAAGPMDPLSSEPVEDLAVEHRDV